MARTRKPIDPFAQYGKALDKHAAAVRALVKSALEYRGEDPGELSSTIAHCLSITQGHAFRLGGERFAQAHQYLQAAIEAFENENHTLRAIKAERRDRTERLLEAQRRSA